MHFSGSKREVQSGGDTATPPKRRSHVEKKKSAKQSKKQTKSVAKPIKKLTVEDLNKSLGGCTFGEKADCPT